MVATATFATLTERLIADAASLGRAGYLPPRPLLDIGVRGFMARKRWRSRSEL